MLEKTREFYNCSSLTGMPLENSPTTSCTAVGSHWEQKYANCEMMVPSGGFGCPFTHVSPMTLALAEDSGWYLVDYTRATQLIKGLTWGYQKGCAFIEDKCVSAGNTKHEEFCTTNGATSCNAASTGINSCSVSEVASAFPSRLQYFTNPLQVGSSALLDYCPLAETVISNRQCQSTQTWATGRVVDSGGTTMYLNNYYEVPGVDSYCFLSSVRAAASVPPLTFPKPASSVPAPMLFMETKSIEVKGLHDSPP